MRARLLAAVAAPLLTAACGLDEIDVVVTGHVTVPGDASAAQLPYAPMSLPVASVDLHKLSGISPREVRSARLRAVTVSVSDGTSLEQWVDSVALWVHAGELAPVLVARRDGVGALPAGTRSLVLDVVPGLDLEPYLAAPATLIVAEGTGRRPTASTAVDVAATLRLRLDFAAAL